MAQETVCPVCGVWWLLPYFYNIYIFMPVTSWDFDPKFDFTADLTVENIEQGEPCQNLIHTIPKIPRKIRKNIPNMSNLGIQFSNPQDLEDLGDFGW